jgi:hypothetical protein
VVLGIISLSIFGLTASVNLMKENQSKFTGFGIRDNRYLDQNASEQPKEQIYSNTSYAVFYFSLILIILIIVILSLILILPRVKQFT